MICWWRALACSPRVRCARAAPSRPRTHTHSGATLLALSPHHLPLNLGLALCATRYVYVCVYMRARGCEQRSPRAHQGRDLVSPPAGTCALFAKVSVSDSEMTPVTQQR